MSAMFQKAFKNLGRRMMAPFTLIVQYVSWMHGGLIRLCFGQTRCPESVQCAMMLFHYPCIQEMLSEYLTKLAEPVLMQSLRANISKSEMLKQRLQLPLQLKKNQRSIVVQPEVRRSRRLQIQRKNDYELLWF